MPSLKPSESKKHSQEEGVVFTLPAPAALKARVILQVRVQGWVHVQRPPLHVSSACKCRGPHQRAVLTLPAWKLYSDKRLGHQKGSSAEGLTARDSSRDEGRGHPSGGGGDWWQTDRREGRPGAGVRYADLLKWQRHELFPWQALPLLCQLILIDGAWSSSICCLLSQIIWTLRHEMDKPSCPHMIPVLPNEIPPPPNS